MTMKQDTNYLYMFCDTFNPETYKIGTTKHITKDKIINEVHSTDGASFNLMYFMKIYSTGEEIINIISKYCVKDNYYCFDKYTNIIYEIKEQMMMEYEKYKSTLPEDYVHVVNGKKNPDYTQGKIYLIRNKSNVYVGSTTVPLFNRLDGHIFDSQRNPGLKIYERINNDWKNWNIELYENYPCENKQQLHRREGEVQKMLCSNLNTVIAGRTNKEYVADNREKINERARQNYQKIAAKRYVRDLNTNAIFFDKCKKATIDKYKIYKNGDGIYCSELLEE